MCGPECLTGNAMRYVLARASALVAFGAGMALAIGCAYELGSEDELLDVSEKSDEIYRGEPAAALPAVVEVRRVKDGGSLGLCSGFFITKRHIVTAAHCTDKVAPADDYEITVKTGYNTFAKLKDPARTDGRVLLTENHVPGFNFDSPSEPRDMAILTLSSTVSSSVPAAVVPLRLSTAAPTIGQAYSIWGWGIKASTGSRPADLLAPLGSQGVTANVVAGDGTYSWLGALVNNDARICEGDSGGPATRYTSSNYIAVGAAVNSRKPNGSQSEKCPQIGDSMRWSTLHDKVAWIEGVLRLTYGSAFSCTRYGAGANAYMKCY